MTEAALIIGFEGQCNCDRLLPLLLASPLSTFTRRRILKTVSRVTLNGFPAPFFPHTNPFYEAAESRGVYNPFFRYGTYKSSSRYTEIIPPIRVLEGLNDKWEIKLFTPPDTLCAS